MSGHKIDLERLALAQSLYESSWLPVLSIEKKTGVSARSIQRRAQREDWSRPSIHHRKHFADRLWQNADHWLSVLESQSPDHIVTASLRDLSALTKVLRDLVDYETAEQAANARAPETDPNRARDQLRQRLQILDQATGAAMTACQNPPKPPMPWVPSHRTSP
ncbi:MAG: hypothetical protein KGQ46_04610 [Hyphomicrobiales bacterium]|nr:hypothetical protein [Hyphomicrobiales bacterium]MDE2114614.1 hypothetical protein [Hyphomicrobiales bacterium]